MAEDSLDLYDDLDLGDGDENQIEGELEDVPENLSTPAPSSNTYTGSAAGGVSGTSQPLASASANANAGYGAAAGPVPNQYGGTGDYDKRGPDHADEGKMFIGGLNWETTDENLRNYMAQYGEVESSQIMRDGTGRSRGFAFLTYKDPASVNNVLKNTHVLDGKQIDPKRAIPRAEHERTAKVFVGGLAATVTSDSLKQFLGQFGQVMDATVMFDRETKRSKGFAFATFADEESVDRAMQNSGMELEGKQIEIKKAQPRGATQPKERFGGNNFNNQQSGFGGGGMGGMGGVGGGGGGFDPNAMAMMYQNMMKSPMGAMGGMGGGGGFDPGAMAMMYQNMMKSMNAPAINPNMAMRNMGMGNMGMGGMGMMGMGNMGMGGMGGMGMMGNMGGMGGGMGRGGGMSTGRPIPNAPRGPAAMRSGPNGGGGGGGNGAGNGGGGSMASPMQQGGTGAQRYSTQGSARSRPY